MAFTATTALFTVAKFASKPLLGKILDKWQSIAIASLLAVVFYQNVLETRLLFWADTIPYLRGQITQQQEQLDNVITANDTLATTIQQNNDRVEQFRQITNQLESDNQLLTLDLDNMRDKTASEVVRILRIPIPATCEGAIDYLREAIPGLQYNNQSDRNE